MSVLGCTVATYQFSEVYKAFANQKKNKLCRCEVGQHQGRAGLQVRGCGDAFEMRLEHSVSAI